MIIFGSTDTGTHDYINKFKKIFKINIKKIKKIDYKFLEKNKKKIKIIITGSRFGRESLDIKLLIWAKKKKYFYNWYHRALYKL